ncbi:hypothetical protein RLEG12_01705 (plasmid) [Rhizobium leguminosarum bv. trifolii CB782]|nr:hypothetical protein RLEG12_01705 [Rhizobium leguminosarum bv. trifolii CB782]
MSLPPTAQESLAISEIRISTDSGGHARVSTAALVISRAKARF